MAISGPLFIASPVKKARVPSASPRSNAMLRSNICPLVKSLSGTARAIWPPTSLPTTAWPCSGTLSSFLP
eukprot:11179367-Lingulodinium_polyedra.AAC.1